DANTPHWANVIGGQLALADAHAGRLEWSSPEGKQYALGAGAKRDDGTPSTVILPRPRGWHFDERHLLRGGQPVVAAIVDAALYVLTNGPALAETGRGPFFYLPKTESWKEAALWDEIFTDLEAAAGIPAGTIKATVLIETIHAAFQMDEILHALRSHAAGLNAGRWDYLFSLIKTFRDSGAAFTLPDRADVTMAVPFMRAYTELLVKTCHRRGAHAIGGMAAFIPDRRDPQRNAAALAKVREDKEREAAAGYDGSWVAHPDLVPTCLAVFDGVLGDRPNQLDVRREEVSVTPTELLNVGATPGSITDAGVRANVAVGLRYLAAWLEGRGAVAIFGLMEDAATAEISRSQLWQWINAGASTVEGTAITHDAVRAILAEEEQVLLGEVAAGDDLSAAERVRQARQLFEQVALADEFTEFLTLPASALID
ncbi:MAG: malate synthase A, partial [Patulibacter sp.]